MQCNQFVNMVACIYCYVEYILLEHIITRNSVFLYVSFHSLMLFRTYHHMHQNYHIYYENYFQNY